jgi:hypothetical protein
MTSKARWWGLVLVVLAAVPARAGWGFGISLGFPVCGPPCCYRPVPVFLPPPVYVQPVPVYQPVPIYPSAPALAPPASAPAPLPAPTREGEVDTWLQRLQLPDDRDRAEAAVQLGRLRATGAVGNLSGLLSNDRSGRVREAAARSLGLLGSLDGLPALQRAALADDDPAVRRSAVHSAETIRASLPRR